MKCGQFFQSFRFRLFTHPFQLAGFTAEEAQKAAKNVMTVETRLAEASKSAVELRDPYANYNKITVAHHSQR